MLIWGLVSTGGGGGGGAVTKQRRRSVLHLVSRDVVDVRHDRKSSRSMQYILYGRKREW